MARRKEARRKKSRTLLSSPSRPALLAPTAHSGRVQALTLGARGRDAAAMLARGADAGDGMDTMWGAISTESSRLTE